MRNKNFFIPILSIVFIITSCISNDDSSRHSRTDTGEINDFVWKGLNSWYYWQKDVPALADNAFSSEADYNNYINSKTPDKLFYNLLYKYQEVDRYSWIVDDLDKLLKQFSGISKSSGMNLGFIKTSNLDVIFSVVNYVVPNSPADRAGIKRGNVILGVNGTPLNTTNYRKLFSDDFKMTYAEKLKEEDGVLSPVGEVKEVSLQTTVLEENPIAFVKTYNVGGKKFGYLVYNGFKSNYNDELNEAFLKLKSEGVTDLILDLRYNGGGAVSSALALGQMITGQYTGKPYVTMDYNDKHKRENKIDKLSEEMPVYEFINGDNKRIGTQRVNSLNLNKIYILTSNGTASASELTITGLKPYIDVVTVGAETYGKFVGSITLVDAPENGYVYLPNQGKRYKWAMQPIVFSYYNANRDPHPVKGVLPNYEISSIKYYFGMKEFGDIDSDPAFRKAYELITGETLRKREYIYPQIKTEYEQIGTTNTLTPFGTEMYIEGSNLEQ
ncbi:PDZ domain-containing protein [Weeksellaceae bacterium TAE3-ERU29]|nr:PDZ domain-containing protein [Weeksellaceae bacterium TAE3-ERU29]